MTGGTVSTWGRDYCPACGGVVSPYCTLCLGRPDPTVTVERIARSVAQVDRAARGTQ